MPAAMGSIYQEIAFKEAKCNVIYMMAWSSLAQAISPSPPRATLPFSASAWPGAGVSLARRGADQPHPWHGRERRAFLGGTRGWL